jgi:hypothetical protein
VIPTLTLLVSLLLGAGAAQELVVRGVRGGETQPFAVGAAGILVSLLLAASALALWRRWPGARRLVLAAASLSVGFHVYAALPPHRNVGGLALLIGAGYGLALLAIYFPRRSSRPA